jgi:hypothetical protein
MRLPPWAVPAIVLAYVGLRITFAFRSRARAPGEAGKTWFQTVPIWIRFFWILLALAMVALAFWNPRPAYPARDPGAVRGGATP